MISCLHIIPDTYSYDMYQACITNDVSGFGSLSEIRMHVLSGGGGGGSRAPAGMIVVKRTRRLPVLYRNPGTRIMYEYYWYLSAVL